MIRNIIEKKEWDSKYVSIMTFKFETKSMFDAGKYDPTRLTHQTEMKLVEQSPPIPNDTHKVMILSRIIDNQFGYVNIAIPITKDFENDSAYRCGIAYAIKKYLADFYFEVIFERGYDIFPGRVMYEVKSIKFNDDRIPHSNIYFEFEYENIDPKYPQGEGKVPDKALREFIEETE